MDIESALQATATVAGGAALAQIVSRRTPIPVPVILMAVGVGLGGDGLGVVDVEAIRPLVELTVILAVALIVFEGGMALNWRLLRVVGPFVRNLVALGLVLTPVVGMLASHFILDFPWRVAALFGALVCVTGPSVITPLLQAIRVNDRIRLTLMGEGIIIDPFGALLTLFLLQLAVAESFDPAGPTRWVVERLSIGIIAGAAGAGAVAGVARLVRRLSSREVSLLTTGGAVVAFATAETVAHESGLVAMVVMGIALGNLHLPHRESISHFQEQVVAFLVASVYILLAAGIQVSSLRALMPEGLLVVAALAVLGRPLVVALAAIGSKLTWRERLFVAAVGPRGVVAASLAGVVAVEAGGRLGAEESEFVAMVFIVIIATIAVQSFYAGPLARTLGVFPMTTVVAGAGGVGRRLAAKLVAQGEEVTLIERDETAVLRAREEGFHVIHGDAGSSDVLRRAGVAHARAFVAALPGDDRSLLAAQLARAHFDCPRVFARVDDPANFAVFEQSGVVVINPDESVATDMATALLSSPQLDALGIPEEGLEAARVTVSNPDAVTTIQSCAALRGVLVVVIRRGRQTLQPNGKTELQIGDQLILLGPAAGLASAREGLSLLRAGDLPE